MFLCSIVDLVSGDLDSAKVDKLADYITKFNHSQAKLLGLVWLTFNNHNVSHLPYFIWCFGSPRHFSSMPFERYNSLMGTIPTSGHKGGVLEATIMCNAAQRSELQHLLAQCNEPFFEMRLLQVIEGYHPLDLSVLDTCLKRKQLDNSTFSLLLDHLNRRVTATSSANTATPPHHRPYWDTTSPSSVAHLNARAEFICTTMMERTPVAIRVGGIGQSGRDNRRNCWCLVSVDGVLQTAKILWIFKKAV